MVCQRSLEGILDIVDVEIHSTMRQAITSLAAIDVLISFSYQLSQPGYIMPEYNENHECRLIEADILQRNFHNNQVKHLYRMMWSSGQTMVTVPAKW